jgi:uncharacterized protein YjbI with pentapeptide repeats
VLVAGLVFTARSYLAAREGQVTDRYTAAVNQLGDDHLAVRLGGIYALERISRDSSRDRATIIEILAALIREADRPASADRPTAEVVAALGVLSRLPGAEKPRPIDLRGAKLAGLRMPRIAIAGADLTDASLDVAHLPDADLRDAVLDFANASRVRLTNGKLEGLKATKADLSGAYLDAADLRRASFEGAVLKAASMPGVNARDANFQAADLELAQLAATGDDTVTRLDGAWFSDSILTNSDLSGVDLRAVLGLTMAQRNAARSDARTRWPADLG